MAIDNNIWTSWTVSDPDNEEPEPATITEAQFNQEHQAEWDAEWDAGYEERRERREEERREREEEQKREYIRYSLLMAIRYYPINKEIMDFKKKFKIDFKCLDIARPVGFFSSEPCCIDFGFGYHGGSNIFLACRFLENFATYSPEEQNKYNVVPFYIDFENNKELVGYIMTTK